MASDEVPAGWVRLNVGGRIFLTMKLTLSSSPFFARLFESDDRMPEASAVPSTYFIDRDPDRFSKVLNYLRDGTLYEDKNCNLEELRVEADFYGLDTLVQIVNAKSNPRISAKFVTVKFAQSDYGTKVEIAISPRDDGHFILRHLQQRYPCRMGTLSYTFPKGLTCDLTACNTCHHCQGRDYNYRCRPTNHGCICPPRDIDGSIHTDAILKNVMTTLETQGYVLDPTIDAAITAAGRTPTSWTFVNQGLPGI
ncbi:BTB/POZ domain-containing protein KCTD17 [Aphelenchoides avenae]|nr:BTB/POZ domain-containing protein KCTD17 [Aphelenchus avenae]